MEVTADCHVGNGEPFLIPTFLHTPPPPLPLLRQVPPPLRPGCPALRPRPLLFPFLRLRLCPRLLCHRRGRPRRRPRRLRRRPPHPEGLRPRPPWPSPPCALILDVALSPPATKFLSPRERGDALFKQVGIHLALNRHCLFDAALPTSSTPCPSAPTTLRPSPLSASATNTRDPPRLHGAPSTPPFGSTPPWNWLSRTYIGYPDLEADTQAAE
uniref:Uncharacterized protein n=1 Tax=Ananas comosus var. bracteatus TaxID=296719 RepID=A0A6V7P1M0_ANACO|nr:unnamed protein product [Ananas comosus var. bracteatus]